MITLKPAELEFLCAWAREEKAANPYSLPAHQLQAAHRVPGVVFIRAIKAWARAEGKRDEDIFTLHSSPAANWPWASDDEMQKRMEDIQSSAAAASSTA